MTWPGKKIPSWRNSTPDGSTNPDYEQYVDASDHDLLHKVGKGDESALGELMERHARRMFAVACSLLGNEADAEDVVQEAFIGAYRSASGFRHEASVKTWLMRILVRQAALIRRRPRRTLPLRDAASDEAVESLDRRLDVKGMLQLLSPEHREVLVLREYERMTYDEMAAVLGVPRGTVESRLYRARQELKEKLKGYQDEL